MPLSSVIRACPLDCPSYSLLWIGINCTNVQEQLALTPSEGMTQRCVSHAEETYHKGNVSRKPQFLESSLQIDVFSPLKATPLVFVFS